MLQAAVTTLPVASGLSVLQLPTYTSVQQELTQYGEFKTRFVSWLEGMFLWIGVHE